MVERSREADYTVLELATHAEGVRFTAAEIGEREETPAALLTKILTRLASAEIVSTYHGVDGGMILACAAGEVLLLELVEGVDGPISLNGCTRHPGLCLRQCDCARPPGWGLMRGQLRNSMDEVRLATLATVAARSSTAD